MIDLGILDSTQRPFFIRLLHLYWVPDQVLAKGKGEYLQDYMFTSIDQG